MTSSTSRAESECTAEVVPEVVIARAPGGVIFRQHVVDRLEGRKLDGKVITDARLDGSKTIVGYLTDPPPPDEPPPAATLF